uniref:Uncharacterized protein n=1 Tax=Eptatretus burgeri TaxID=7764 RepID=A0A8C4PWC2_EPTBU
MRDILESYDADFTLAGCSPQLIRRTNEAEASAQRLPFAGPRSLIVQPISFLQGACNSNKERIFHLLENPASAALQQNRVRATELQTECDNLRECIRAFEAGNCTSGTLSDLPPPREVSGEVHCRG